MPTEVSSDTLLAQFNHLYNEFKRNKDTYNSTTFINLLNDMKSKANALEQDTNPTHAIQQAKISGPLSNFNNSTNPGPYSAIKFQGEYNNKIEHEKVVSRVLILSGYALGGILIGGLLIHFFKKYRKNRSSTFIK